MLVAKRIVSPVEMAALSPSGTARTDAARRPTPRPRLLNRRERQAEVEAARANPRRQRSAHRGGLQRVPAQRRRGGLLGELLIQRGVGPAQLAETLQSTGWTSRCARGA